jgi:hypothetical protein
VNAGTSREREPTPTADVRHRREGKAQVGKEQPRLGAVLRDNPREVILTVLGVVIAVGWGTSLISSGSTGTQLLGLLCVLGGLLLGASYLLRFNPRYLRDPRWSSSRTRRVLRLLLAHGWVAFFAVYLVAGLALVVTQR